MLDLKWLRMEMSRKGDWILRSGSDHHTPRWRDNILKWSSYLYDQIICSTNCGMKQIIKIARKITGKTFLLSICFSGSQKEKVI